MTSVQVRDDGPVRVITLDGPDTRNAVGPRCAFALYEAFNDFDADAEARVAVLHGQGGHFCSGFDLRTVAAGEAEAWLESLHFGRPGEPPIGPMGPTRLALSKPVIAAVAGAAVAGGLELALWCDLRIMEKSAYMGVYCRRWGVPLVDGGTVRLPRIVGVGRALDLILTGRRVDAPECHAIGLCDRVVSDGDSLAAAAGLARELAALPQGCLRADRATARFGPAGEELEALREEFSRGREVLEQARQGAVSFTAGAGRHGEKASGSSKP